MRFGTALSASDAPSQTVHCQVVGFVGIQALDVGDPGPLFEHASHIVRGLGCIGASEESSLISWFHPGGYMPALRDVASEAADVNVGLDVSCSAM